MADWIGACPGDQPNATRGIDISRAVLRARLLTRPMQAVQMELARRSVGAWKMSSAAVKRKTDFIKGQEGLMRMWSTWRLSATLLMFSQATGETKVVVECERKYAEIVVFDKKFQGVAGILASAVGHERRHRLGTCL